MKKRTILYLVFSIGFAWAVWIGVYLLGWDMTNTTVSLVMQLGTWAPALAVLLVKLMDGQNGPVLYNGFRPNFKGNIRWYLLAWLLPVVLMLLGATLYFIIFPNALDFGMSYLRATYEMALGDTMAITPNLLMIGLVSGVATMLTITPLISMVYSLGGEIGWRGYLFPALKERFNVIPAHLITGLVWGLWQAPMIVLTGQNYGIGYVGAPWLGILAMCVFCFANGVILSWLCSKTHSVWVAALGLGSINAAASMPVFFLNINEPVNLLLGPYTTGLIAGIPALILAVILMVTEHRAENKSIFPPDKIT